MTPGIGRLDTARGHISREAAKHLAYDATMVRYNASTPSVLAVKRAATLLARVAVR